MQIKKRRKRWMRVEGISVPQQPKTMASHVQDDSGSLKPQLHYRKESLSLILKVDCMPAFQIQMGFVCTGEVPKGSASVLLLEILTSSLSNMICGDNVILSGF